MAPDTTGGLSTILAPDAGRVLEAGQALEARAGRVRSIEQVAGDRCDLLLREAGSGSVDEARREYKRMSIRGTVNAVLW